MHLTTIHFIAYGRLINYTCIDSLFGGHLLSTIVCEQCKTCYQNIEPFLDLSLPIVDDKSVNIYFKISMWLFS